VDIFDRAIEIRSIGHTHGYNHEIWVKTVDETLFTEVVNEFDRARTEALVRHLFTRDGIGGSYVQSIQYEGVVGTREIPNPYHTDRPYTYYVHRTVVTIRVSGTD
jgi:hypothetical protein